MGGKISGVTLLLAVLGTACGSGKSAPGAASGGGAGAPGAGGAPAEVELRVFPARERRAISPLIYGVNGTTLASSMRAKLVRFGGHGSPAYNWEINATNGGRLGGYANRSAGGGSSPGAAAKAVIDQAAENGGAAILTVPIGDYVAADSNAGDVRTGKSYLAQRFDGNKPAMDGPLPATPDLTDGVVYQNEFASWAKGAAGSTPVLFALDNEPSLWFEDHAEIHPQRTGYDELVTRDVSVAKAIKSVWPGVPVLGYVGYGWQSFKDLQQSPDAKTKGEFLAYYLDQMRAAQNANGKRLIDYLDVHWWPELYVGGTRITQPGAGPAMRAARLQAPRELWDPGFREDSWIQDELGDKPIQLIPWLEGEISAHYPGTKLSISAWYYGGGGDISGALATADVLGIFGREGVDAAAIDLSGGTDTFTLAAFSAYLDYDGKGGHFGDTSVDATTNDTAGSSVYASIDAANPSHMVIIALNKRETARPTTLNIGGATAYRTCRVYALTPKSARIAAYKKLASTGDNTFSYDMPALSLSVIVPRQ